MSPDLEAAVTVALCVLARAAGYPWSDTVDLRAASQWAAQRLTMNTNAVTVDGKPACTASLKLDDGREWSAGGANAGETLHSLATIVRRDVADGPHLVKARACVVDTLWLYQIGELAQVVVNARLLASREVRTAIVVDLGTRHPGRGWLAELIKLQLEDLAEGRADRILVSEAAWLKTECEVCARAAFLAVDPTAVCERHAPEPADETETFDAECPL